MKTVLGVLIVGILTLLLGWILPWWSIGIAGCLGGFTIGKSGVNSFLIGFIGTGLTWLIMAGYIDASNGGLLSEKIAKLFGGIPKIGLILLSALVGGLASGLSGITGYFAKKSFT